VVAAAHAAAAAANTRPMPHRPAASASSADHTAAAELGLRIIARRGVPIQLWYIFCELQSAQCGHVGGCVLFGRPPAAPGPLG